MCAPTYESLSNVCSDVQILFKCVPDVQILFKCVPRRTNPFQMCAPTYKFLSNVCSDVQIPFKCVPRPVRTSKRYVYIVFGIHGRMPFGWIGARRQNHYRSKAKTQPPIAQICLSVCRRSAFRNESFRSRPMRFHDVF